MITLVNLTLVQPLVESLVSLGGKVVMVISSCDGTLSSSDFCLTAHAFAEKWKRINPVLPSWSWVPRPKSPWLASHEVSFAHHFVMLGSIG